MLDVLSDVLSRLAIRGTLYFRTSFTSPWGVEVPPFENVARFHYASRGECFVRIAGTSDIVSLAQGDLVIIPHGAGHSLYCAATEDDAILHLDRVIEESGYDGDGVLVYGGDSSDDRPTQLICGHISFASDARHPIFERLPPYIHIRNYGESSASWMEATLRAIGEEAGQDRMGADFIALKMSEVIFAQALRTFIESQAAERVGLSGFADPHIGRALAAFHKQPSEAWTVESLAREAGLSRTGFAQRFAQKMGVTPMQYLTSWRVQLAREALAAGQVSTIEAAELAGYVSEAAFARVFKKDVGVTPAAYRASRA
jgi:AraC family transcriptional regulator, activator of mtrCDE